MLIALFFEFEGLALGKNIPDFYEIVTAPIMKVCYTFSTDCFYSVDCIMTSSSFME